MKQGDALVVLIIGAVLFFALVAPSLLTAGSGLWQGLMDFVKEGFGNLGGLSGTHSEVGLLVHYDDGTEQFFDASTPTMTILDPDSKKQVTWVKPQVYVTVTKTGVINSWTCMGTLKTSLKEDIGTTTVYDWSDIAFQKSGASWENIGESKLMAERTITADELDNLLLGAGKYESNDQFDLSCYAEVNELTMTFADGKVETWTRADVGAYRTTWTFLWVISEIQSISVSISLATG